MQTDARKHSEDKYHLLLFGLLRIRALREANNISHPKNTPQRARAPVYSDANTPTLYFQKVFPNTSKSLNFNHFHGCITKHNAKHRMHWCAPRYWTLEQWGRVLWSDKSHMFVWHSDGQVWVSNHFIMTCTTPQSKVNKDMDETVFCRT